MSSSEELEKMLKKNIIIMNALEGFDVVIVCCSSTKLANYWQKRLEDGRGSVLPKQSVVLAVQEDWPGGAGNALGTLYAYQNAVALAKLDHGLDLDAELLAGRISVGLFHTAGKGTRLAPLPGAENNNKPGVKLPATIKLENSNQRSPITILEAVIKQTGCYAKSRVGRLSVFWGDQVFIPTAPVEYSVTHHVDILCSLGPMMSETDWKDKGMDKYGLIAQTSNGGAAQVEKVSHATAVQLLSSLGEIESVGVSLGSFSVSSIMLQALLIEFTIELKNKKGKLDSDPHLWMPMTLSKDAYLHLMEQKNIASDISGQHYDRMKNFLNKFNDVVDNKKLGIFGPVDVGQGVYWWDYGQLKLYQKYNLLATSNSNEAKLMRLFFSLDDHQVVDSVLHNTTVTNGSCISSCTLGTPVLSSKMKSGYVNGSVLTGVRCNHIEAEGCILVNVTAERIIAAPGSIIYNIVADGDDQTLTVAAGQVLAGVFSDDGSQHIVKSDISIDGGQAWEKVLEDVGNTHSFEQVYNSNTDACPVSLEKIILDSHAAAWLQLSPAVTSKKSLSSSDDSCKESNHHHDPTTGSDSMGDTVAVEGAPQSPVDEKRQRVGSNM